MTHFRQLLLFTAIMALNPFTSSCGNANLFVYDLDPFYIEVHDGVAKFMVRLKLIGKKSQLTAYFENNANLLSLRLYIHGQLTTLIGKEKNIFETLLSDAESIIRAFLRSQNLPIQSLNTEVSLEMVF